MHLLRRCLLPVVFVVAILHAAPPAGAFGSVGSIASVAEEIPVSGDWDGNGSDTIAVFRAGTWYLRNSNSSGGVDVSFQWGSVHDIPVAGDWDGDGTDTVGVFRNGTFYLRNSNSSGGVDLVVETGRPGAGRPGAVPLAGDWDGDGVSSVGIWESGALSMSGVPNYSVFSLWADPSSTLPSVSFSWGVASDAPVAGDWDGDGTSTIGVYRGGTWFLRNTNSSGGVDRSFPWGAVGDVPVVGDWDGDGTSTIGVRRANHFYQRNTNDSGAISASIEWGLPTVVEPRLPGANSTFYTNTAAHPASANGFSRLTAVTMAHNIGFDRIVYRFADGFPLYRIFMGPPETGHIQNGEFVVPGAAALWLVFFDGGEWMQPPPYLPKTLTGSTRSITEAKNISDFEAGNIWLVGMDRARAFRVIELTNPTRIVVDVQTDDYTK